MRDKMAVWRPFVVLHRETCEECKSSENKDKLAWLGESEDVARNGPSSGEAELEAGADGGSA